MNGNDGADWAEDRQNNEVGLEHRPEERQFSP
jgi:hypothetical protein